MGSCIIILSGGIQNLPIRKDQKIIILTLCYQPVAFGLAKLSAGVARDMLPRIDIIGYFTL
jgi:hypothetical protein